jgi:hypothetical protein
MRPGKRGMRNPLLAGLAIAYMLAVHLTIIKGSLRFNDDRLSAPTTTLSLQETAPANDTKDSFVAARYGPQFAINVNHERLANISLQRGNWIGNTWIPPHGWRAFSAADLRTLYKDRSILWIGDSTNRRTAYSFHAIVNSDVNASWINTSDVSVRDSRDPILHDIDSALIIDIDRYDIIPTCKRIPREMWGKFNIHVCRHMHHADDFSEGQKDSQYVSKHLLLQLLQHNVTPSALNEINARELNSSNPTLLTTAESLQEWQQTSAARDYKEPFFIMASQRCLAEVIKPIQAELALEPHLRLTSLVDTVVINAGIWEAYYHTTASCDNMWFHIAKGANTTHADRLQVIFDTLMELQTPTLEIVYRTPGYATFNETMPLVDDQAEYTRQYAAKIYAHSRFVQRDDGSLKCMYKGDAYTVAPFANWTTINATSSLHGTRCAPNLTFVDWAGAVRPRSFTERIIGDIPPHYGFEPRHAMIQMLTNHWLERRQAGL